MMDKLQRYRYKAANKDQPAPHAGKQLTPACCLLPLPTIFLSSDPFYREAGANLNCFAAIAAAPLSRRRETKALDTQLHP